VNPDRPFVLRTDASGYAVGATLEQLVDEDRLPTPEDVLAGKTVPVAFMSRKLTPTQRNWVPREQETYAIILALQKWESWIGLQQVLVLTDHQALESWAREVLDTPSGPLGRRARWHQILSKYDLHVGYIPGKENVVADILSRWAYPAGEFARDTSIHGSENDDIEMTRIMDEEKCVERGCVYMTLCGPPDAENLRESRATRKRQGKGSAGPTPPRRFYFKQPQGGKAKSDAQEVPPTPATPPERRAGEGVGVSGTDGMEDESSPKTPVYVNPESESDFDFNFDGEFSDGGGGRHEPSSTTPPRRPLLFVKSGPTDY
jgi:hypothetical protein